MKLAPPPGTYAPWYINNREENLKFNDVWDEKVLPYFPGIWDGAPGPEGIEQMESAFVYFDHEWKRLNRHCSFYQSKEKV